MKVGRTYHLFASEMAGDPVWVRMKLGHWRSDVRVPNRSTRSRRGFARVKLVD